ELSCDSLRNTECLHEIVKVESFLFGFEGAPTCPPCWNEDDGDVRQGRGFQCVETCRNMLAQLQSAPLFVQGGIDLGACHPQVFAGCRHLQCRSEGILKAPELKQVVRFELAGT